jgi:hypothetical protein
LGKPREEYCSWIARKDSWGGAIGKNFIVKIDWFTVFSRELIISFIFMQSELSIFASHYKVGKVNIHLILVTSTYSI